MLGTEPEGPGQPPVRQLRLLVVSQYFWPESFRVNDLVQAWRERQHEVTVLTGLPNYPAGRFYAGYSLTGPYRETFADANVRRVPLLPRGPRRGLRLVQRIPREGVRPGVVFAAWKKSACMLSA